MAALDKKRQPEAVRAALVQATIDGASRSGLAEVSLQDIASLAGVSKGGLFHYFSSRQDLIDVVFSKCLNDFGDSITALMKEDTAVHGRFTRAYVRAMIDACSSGDGARSLFAFSALTEKRHATAWRSWMQAKLNEHPAEQNLPLLRVARSAADGLWLQSFGTSMSEQERAAAVNLRAHLIALTHAQLKTDG